MNIYKVKEDVWLYDLNQWLLKKNIGEGQRFGISWKVKKRRKLKAYTLLHHRHWVCDDCGSISEVELKRGNKIISIDNHFGPSNFGMNSGKVIESR
jgi:hypothetical protein